MKQTWYLALAAGLLQGVFLPGGAIAQTPPAPSPDGSAFAEAPSGPGVQTPATPVVPAGYRMRPGDVIQVDVFREPELASRPRLDEAGQANLPLLGKVTLRGKTAGEAADLIRALYDKDYLVRPQVTVVVLEFVKREYVILGQVRTPGSYAVGESGQIDLLGAVAQAGGFLRMADQGRVSVKRTTQGREQVLRVNAKRMATDSEEPRFQVLPGDIITVPESIF